MTETIPTLEDWFSTRKQEIASSLLVPGGNEYQQAGWTGEPEHYRAAHELILDGITAGGDILDIGCANGLLLASLVAWGSSRGYELEPHGIDFVPELIELARQRFQDRQEQFAVANAWDWSPGRQYRWVHTELDYVPKGRQTAYLRRLLDEIVAPGGRLLVSSYGDQAAGRRPVDIDLHLQMLGFRTLGCSNGMQSDRWVATRTAWIEHPG